MHFNPNKIKRTMEAKDPKSKGAIFLRKKGFIFLDETMEELSDAMEEYKASPPSVPERLSEEEIEKMAHARYYASGDNHEKGLIQGFQDGYKRARVSIVTDEQIEARALKVCVNDSRDKGRYIQGAKWALQQRPPMPSDKEIYEKVKELHGLRVNEYVRGFKFCIRWLRGLPPQEANTNK